MTGSVFLSWARKNFVRIILFAAAVIEFVLGHVSIGLLFVFLFGWSLIRRYQRDFYVLQYISTQIARNDLDIGLLKKVLDDTAIDAVEFELGNVGPLSWDLTATQKDEIRQQWLKDESLSAMRKVAALFPNVASQ